MHNVLDSSAPVKKKVARRRSSLDDEEGRKSQGNSASAPAKKKAARRRSSLEDEGAKKSSGKKATCDEISPVPSSRDERSKPPLKSAFKQGNQRGLVGAHLLPQDKPIIDPEAYHLKFCLRRKKHKKQSKPLTRPQMPDMPPIGGGPPFNDRDQIMGNFRGRGMNMMDLGMNMRDRGMNDMGPRQNMGGNMMGNMDFPSQMMTMDQMSPEEQMEMGFMSPAVQRMTLGMGECPGGIMRPSSFRRDSDSRSMMNIMAGPSPGGRNMPGNLQELRAMMGRDKKLMGNRDGPIDGMGSRDGPLNRTGSRGSSGSNDKKKPRFSDSDHGGRGTPSHCEEDMLIDPGFSAMREPLLPTPAEIKPSFKKAYKDISFSPLDRLDRGLMQRIMAFQDSNEHSGNPMAGMPPLPTNTDKRKLSDFAYSPRSPNPKKSFLERAAMSRAMNNEMKGHLDEAMASFSKFQRKYSGGSAGNDSNMRGEDLMRQGNSNMGDINNIGNPSMMNRNWSLMDNQGRFGMENSGMMRNRSFMNNPMMDRMMMMGMGSNMGMGMNPMSMGMGMNPMFMNDNMMGMPMGGGYAGGDANGVSSAPVGKPPKKSKKDPSKDTKKKPKKIKEQKKATKSKNVEKKRKDGKDGRPKRPFSAYNLFFQLEREVISEFLLLLAEKMLTYHLNNSCFVMA